MNVAWELNPVSLIAVATTFVGLVAFWLDTRSQAREAKSEAIAARASAKEAHDKVEILKQAIAAHREVQAERLVSREVLREVEDRLASSIDRLGDRFDVIVKEILADRHIRHGA